MNKFLKFFSSLPIILVFLYYLPFLGVCLIILRYFIYNNRTKRNATSIYLITIGVVVLIPYIINKILLLIKCNISNLSYFNNIVNSNLYNINFINYSKKLITIGIIFMIISAIMNSIFNKLGRTVKDYISSEEKRNYEISQKNDLIIKEKQEKAKNTHYVKCPNCGSDNLVSDKFETCKFCRSKLVNKN